MTTLKEVFDDLTKEVTFDKGLLSRLYKYHTTFLNQSSEYLSFFASNLIGVHVVRFRVVDIQRFYHDVLGLDMTHVRREVLKVTTINHSYHITSDDMNLMLMYIIHRISTSMKLSESDRTRGVYDAALIFFYRCLVIRQSDYFHFPADKHIAQAAYAELSNKFLIKQLGNWKAVMDYRAKDLINPEGLHLKNLIVFEDDDLVTYAISDSENRVRELYKSYCKVFHQVYSSGDRISSTSATITDVEGVEKIRERVREVEQAIALIQNTLHDAKSFIKPELLKVIIEINTNTSQRMLMQVLSWLSENYMGRQWHAKIDEFVRLIVIHSYHLVAEMGEAEINDLPSVLVTLKNLYLSTRSADPELLKIRKLGEQLVKESAGKVNPSLEMATRTSVILYITLRTFMTVK